MFGLRKIALALVAGFSLSLFSTGASADPLQDNVKSGLKALKQKLETDGAPRIEGENLFFGKRKINGDTEAVDELKETKAVTATIFMKQDAKFVRVSTNIMRDGKRAVGTELDPKGAVYPLVSKGTAYQGRADILGKAYETIYEPIFDANKQLVGVYLVALPVAP